MDGTYSEASLSASDVELLRDVAVAGALLAPPSSRAAMARLDACGLVVVEQNRYELTRIGRIRAVLWEGWTIGPSEDG